MMEILKGTFLKAIKNEIYIDEIENKRFHILEYFGTHILKPSKFIRYKRNGKLIGRIFKGLTYFWFIIGGILIGFQFLIAIFKNLTSSKQTLNGKSILLLFSHRLTQLTTKCDIDFNNFYVVSLKNNNEKEKNYIISQLTNFNCIWESFKLSFQAHRILCKIYGKTDYKRLNSKFAFDWFLVYNTLANLKLSDLSFCNHYDRWAILFDSLDVPNKILLQHGILSPEVFPPTKLSSISSLVCFNLKEENIFVRNVMDNIPSIRYYISKLNLHNIAVEGKINILLVSCLPITFESEKKLLNSCHCMENLNFYVKPHPVYPIEEYLTLQKEFQFTLITDKSVFPKVDIVISYASTLGMEYQNVGIKVLYYEENTEDELTSIFKRLNDDYK